MATTSVPITADALRKHFGFNNEAVIQGILSDPGQVERYSREYAGVLYPGINKDVKQTPSPVDLLDEQKKKQADLEARQKKESDAFFQTLDTRINQQEALPAASKRIEGELGLPDLRYATQSLNETLKQASESFRDIPYQQQAISKQVGISAPHLEARIRAEQQKQQPAVETAARGAQSAISAQEAGERELGQQLALLVTQQEKELRPLYQAALPLLQDRLAREQANFTNDKEAELNLLLTNINNEFQATQSELNRQFNISQADLDRANQLAVAEQNYQNSLERIKFTTDEEIRKATALEELKGTSTGSGSPAAKYFNIGGETITNLWDVAYT